MPTHLALIGLSLYLALTDGIDATGAGWHVDRG